MPDFSSYNNQLDASYLETPDKFYTDFTFMELLDFIYSCYKKMLNDKILVPHNDENTIRDFLVRDYLNNNTLRHSMDQLNFLFDPEVPENDGRSDIKVQTLNTLIDTRAYYIIECKRLDGYSTLNKEYITNGINRFITRKYSSYYKVNGMIGFIVKAIDVDKNLNKIDETFIPIKRDKLYISKHKELDLYHLMLDFSSNLL